MFERFTDRARRVVVLAQEEARMLDHNYIGTEHILLGLIHEQEGLAAKALTSLGISLQAVRRQVEEIIGRGKHAPTGHIPFTPRAKKVLELSLREALQLGHNYIGTEHILLGLIREGDGVAAQVLVRLGADLNRVRHQVIQLVHVAKSDRPTRIAAGESVRLRVPGDRWIAELQVTLARLTERIDAIEQHLGIAAPAPGTADHPEERPAVSGSPEERPAASDSPEDPLIAADVPDRPAQPPASPSAADRSAPSAVVDPPPSPGATASS
jgi:hypothetical protein